MADANAYLGRLKTLLQAQFDARADLFPQGVDVVLRTSETSIEERTGLPCLVLRIESDATSRWNGANGRLRDCVVPFVAEATDYNGAQVGVENPSPVQVEMVRFFRDYVVSNRQALNATGFEMPEIRMESDGVVQATNDIVKTANGRFFFTYDYTQEPL